MDKKTDLSSSVYFSDKAFSLRSPPASKNHPHKRPHYKIQIVNQNLNQAIAQVKANIKDNPQWQLTLKCATNQYSPNRQAVIGIDQTIQEHHGISILPQSTKQPLIRSQQTLILQKLMYTDRLKREYDERMNRIKEKRMQLQVESLGKQMKAKLDRKVKQNIALRQKAKLIEQIQERRQQAMKFLDQQHLKTKQEKSLLHQSNTAKVEMLRRFRDKSKKRQLSQSLSQYQQSKLELRFKEFLTDKQKSQRKEMLLSRYKMLRTSSQGSIRKQRAQNVRQIRTSQANKRNGQNQLINPS